MTTVTMNDLVKEREQEHYLNPNDYGEEGIDHINVSFSSKTFLGNFLNPTYSAGLKYPLVGGFRSIANLLAYIRSDGSIKNLRKLSAKEISRLPRSVIDGHFTNFRAVLLLATLRKISGRKGLGDTIRNLPKDITVLSYTEPRESNTRMVTSFAYYVVPIMTELIRSIQENRDPDYSLFLDVKGLEENGFLETLVGFEFMEDGNWGTKIALGLGDLEDRFNFNQKKDAYVAKYSSVDKLIDAFNDAVSKITSGDSRLVPITEIT